MYLIGHSWLVDTRTHAACWRRLSWQQQAGAPLLWRIDYVIVVISSVRSWQLLSDCAAQMLIWVDWNCRTWICKTWQISYENRLHYIRAECAILL